MRPVRTFKTFSKDVITLLEKLNVHNVVSKSKVSKKLVSAGNLYFPHHGGDYNLHIQIMCVPYKNEIGEKINYMLYLFRDRKDFPNRGKKDNVPFSRAKLITATIITYDSYEYNKAEWNEAAENKIIGLISDIEKADEIRSSLALNIKDMLKENLFHYPAIDTTIYFEKRFNINLKDGIVKMYINNHLVNSEVVQINVDKRMNNADNRIECLVFYGTDRRGESNDDWLLIGDMTLYHDDKGKLSVESERKLLMTIISCLYCPRLNGYGVYSNELPVNNYLLDCKDTKAGYKRLIPVTNEGEEPERLGYDELHPMLRYYDLLIDSLLYCTDVLPSYNEKMEDKLDIIECTLSLDNKNNFTFTKLLKFRTNPNNWLGIAVISNNDYNRPDIILYGTINNVRVYKSITMKCPRLDYEDCIELDWDGIDRNDRMTFVKFGKTMQNHVLDAIKQE